ncbi:MAG: efflux RND transporter permease subunit [Gammaproteobacteria bacterium]|nr:CusA/CzcA family heavy metal efflux RND transporter [Gammaproteobacteria bacterium]NIN62119.1 CusA/CzcA family heavy metal efflux RND transporter [Gammaproteobacteria bacterium]NIO63613.1 CusA/CzcA family heavy metal efflux RND transporter [Gammaproteobacteria bacterium]NIP49001.1 efflux RND transporter permease subunit [Gammaproteobacteria bacterium]NIQ09457.1 efflux RND transporter permease subunit [Gammaproteobacteria bacterium]
MIEFIIDWSIRNRFLILLLSILLVFAGIYTLKETPVDAIPDLSDVQVIIKTSYPGQAPQVVEDQVTYPLTTAMLSVPYAVTVRGYSFFGDSYVYVIFKDGTDLYWARTRVLEYLSQIANRLPANARPALGPDATGVGWIYEYALIDRSGNNDLSRLRSLQDWFLKYELQTIPGVAEVATVGGFVKQYQVVVDPNRLRAYDIPLSTVIREIKRANEEVGASVIEMAEAEYMIRSSGYITGIDDIQNIPLSVTERGVPVLLGDIAHVRIGPQLRRGLAELNGEGEVVGGVVIMRWGDNAMKTINAVKERLQELGNSLPEGVEIIETYDRSDLIKRAIENLRGKLVEEFIIVALVCAVFLFHFRSSLIIVLSLPLGILIAFIVMYLQGINANIMSLGGIAIAIGAMVDAAIVMIENVHKHLEKSEVTSEQRWKIISDVSKEVGPPLFFSLLIITLSFLPVFTLEAQEGRLFKPLAYTKTYAMAAAAGLSITLIPVLMGYLIRGKIIKENKNPVNRLLIFFYRPFIRLALTIPKTVIFAAIIITVIGFYPLKNLGTEFMPELDEGDLLYMPSTFPAVSVGKAQEILQQTDKLIRTIPEVETVFGKMGRAETATDPAPLSMVETTIQLKPRSEWREGLDLDGLKAELNRLIQFPGLSNVFVMPIKNRIDMLATGIKTPVGIKISGPDLKVIDKIGLAIEPVVKEIPGAVSVYSERVTGGRYIQIDIDQLKAARLGLNIKDVQDIIQAAIGGVNVTETVEGLERYPVNVRYPRAVRESVPDLRLLPVVTPTGARIPLGDIADINIVSGPPMIKSENARLTGWVFVDIAGRDIAGFVEEAKRAIANQVNLPSGYSLAWSGQYEYLQRAEERLRVVVPFTLVIIALLLYLNFRNLTEVAIIMLSLPFALVGGICYLYLLGYHLSVAIGVGFIALAGVAAETGVVMLVFLNQAYRRKLAIAEQRNLSMTEPELKEAVIEGALLRVRPLIMTVTAIIAGLVPIMFGTGTGSEVMQRIAAPMFGGMITATVLTLIVIPAIYYLWRKRSVNLTGKSV